MKRIKSLFVLFIAFGTISLNVSAGLFGGGGSLKKIVKILSVIKAKQTLMQIDVGKDLFEAIQQTQNQLRQIELEMTNMLSLGQELTTGQLQALMRDYQELLAIQQGFKDSLNSFKDFEQAFKDTYTDFKNLEGLSATDYINKADNLLTRTREITQSSFALVGLGDPQKMANDAQRVSALMRAANKAEGHKAVLQAGVNMAGEQTRILGELRTLLASSLKTQNAEEMRKLQNEKAIMEYEKEIGTHKSYTDKLKNSKVDMTNRRW